MVKEKTYSVYKHTFIEDDNKVYIGITSMPVEKRWRKGKGYRRRIRGKFTQKAMAKAVAKWDWDTQITHEVLFTGLTKEEAKRIESELIQKYQSHLPEYGYNLAL